MVCEALDLGPQYYCMMQSSHPGFAKQVFLLIEFFPHHKMYFYPNVGLPLRGPFDQSLCTREINLAMSQHISPFEERPLMCKACDSYFCNHVMERLVELWLLLNRNEFYSLKI